MGKPKKLVSDEEVLVYLDKASRKRNSVQKHANYRAIYVTAFEVATEAAKDRWVHKKLEMPESQTYSFVGSISRTLSKLAYEGSVVRGMSRYGHKAATYTTLELRKKELEEREKQDKETEEFNKKKEELESVLFYKAGVPIKGRNAYTTIYDGKRYKVDIRVRQV